jgi:arylsulfatase A-like enzyme
MTPFKTGCILLCLLLLPAAGCGKKSPFDDGNVIIILIDTLRRDKLGVYNDRIDFSPGLDRLAREGFRFTRAVAPSPWTKPSVASLFTGLYSGNHGVLGDHVVLTNMAHLDPSFTTLAERFKTEGFSTAAFVTNPQIQVRYHFDQGFDTFVQPAGDAGELLGKAEEWIDSQSGRFFLYLHLIDPHEPYMPPPDYKARFAPGEPGDKAPLTAFGRPRELVEWLDQYQQWRAGGEQGEFEFDYEPLVKEVRERLSGIDVDLTEEQIRSHLEIGFKGLDDPELLRRAEYLMNLYDGEVAYTDDQIHAFLKRLEGSGLLDKTVLIVTADHGEAFLEHGYWGHRRSVYYTETDIPMFFRIPGMEGKPVNGVSNDLVSLVDLYPTLLDMYGIDAPAGLAGVSLWPAMRDGTPLKKRPVYSEAIFAYGDHVSAQVEHDKVVRSSTSNGVSWKHYDLKNDPEERHPLKPEEGGPGAKALMKAVEGLLDRRTLDFEKAGDAGGLTEQERKQLEELGYL